MSHIRAQLDDQVRAGRLREQCAHCEHDQKFHDKKNTRRCNVCWDFCVYEPAWVIRRPSPMVPERRQQSQSR
jgi:hypothetical protein